MSPPSRTPVAAAGPEGPAKWRRLPTRSLGAALLLLLVACVEPELVEEQAPTGGDLPEIAEAPPTDDAALQLQLERLEATFVHLERTLTDAEQATNLEEARAAGADALRALVGEGAATGVPPGGTTEGETNDERTDIGGPAHAGDVPLFPSETPDRAVAAEDAILIAAVTAARDAGGSLGRELIAMLGDAVAGDLGAWQRDPAGMVALARDTGERSMAIDRLESAILELPGEGTRALAWVFVIVDADDVELSRQAAHRAHAHVGLMAAAFAELTATDGAPA
jgi:hypothetical protein